MNGLRIATDLNEQVSISNLTPAMSLGAVIVAGVYYSMGLVCEITSGRDGKHKVRSLHYSGNALDFRTRTVPAQLQEELVGKIRRALGQDFQVVLEPTHLHVEYQPLI